MFEICLVFMIMLVREKEGMFEVLLVWCNKLLNFVGGVWVFLGGKIDEIEIYESESELEVVKWVVVCEIKEEVNLVIDFEWFIFFWYWIIFVGFFWCFVIYFFFVDIYLDGM